MVRPRKQNSKKFFFGTPYYSEQDEGTMQGIGNLLWRPYNRTCGECKHVGKKLKLLWKWWSGLWLQLHIGGLTNNCFQFLYLVFFQTVVNFFDNSFILYLPILKLDFNCLQFVFYSFWICFSLTQSFYSQLVWPKLKFWDGLAR